MKIKTAIFLLLILHFATLIPMKQGISKELAQMRSEIKSHHIEAEERYAEDAAALEGRVSQIRQEIDELTVICSSHENCVALALQMNAESVMAEMYDRTEAEQRVLCGDDRNYALYYGRLRIPDAKIDVALYASHKQYITDREDSANIFTWGAYSGQSIADHNNQEFAKLFAVEHGTLGYIELADGDIVNIECVAVLDGFNAGKDVTDSEGVSAMGRADYMMYTCRDGWQNVRICLWNEF